MELHIVLNKLRFQKIKMLLALKKRRVMCKLFPKKLLFFSFLFSGLLFAALSQKEHYEFLSLLFDAVKNVSYSYVAGYIFYIVSDVYPKSKRKLDEMEDIINNELCILGYAKSLIDPSVRFSTSTYLGTDNYKKFIVNCTKSDPYKNGSNSVELNDSFLNRLHFVHNECGNSFCLLLEYKNGYLNSDDIKVLLELQDFIFLKKTRNEKMIFLCELEMEYFNFLENIQKLEKSISEQIKIYVYNPCKYDKLIEELKSTDNYSLY